MRRLFAFIVALAGMAMLAGAVSAHEMKSDTQMKGSWDLGSASQVKAAVVEKSGDTVRLYAPDGNNVLCKGDTIPIFRSAGMMEEDMPSGRMEEGEPFGSWREEPSGGMPPESVREPRTGDMSAMIESRDIKDMDLVGEVVIDNLVGTNYAEGRLIVGDASHGDISSKPSAQCLVQPGMPETSPSLSPDFIPQG